MGQNDEPFWRTKSFAQMTRDEWESLCDGCARCCLIKLVDDSDSEKHGRSGPCDNSHSKEVDEQVYYTDVACRLLDLGTCRCSDYANRTARVPDCVALTPESLDRIDWLPPTCAYRLVAEGEDLKWWHPLISGTAQSVHDAGISIRGRAISEDELCDEDIEGHIVSWPVSTAE